MLGQRNLAIIPDDNEVKRGNVDFSFRENIAAVKRFNNRGVTLLGTALEGCNQDSPV